MADYPVNFPAPMVIALLAGRKTQTRLLATTPFARCRPGDRLWVRETFAPISAAPDGGRAGWRVSRPADAEHAMLRDGTWRHRDGADARMRSALMEGAVGRRWCGPIAMPRWASRLTLTIEACRTEPLRAITDAGARAEGLEGWPLGLPILWRFPMPHWSPPRRSPRSAYRDMWDRLHGTPGERWADDPPVIALTFRISHENIDERSG